MRAMKVVVDSQWSDEAWKYLPREDGRKTLEFQTRTAVEDVGAVDAIASYFS